MMMINMIKVSKKLPLQLLPNPLLPSSQPQLLLPQPKPNWLVKFSDITVPPLLLENDLKRWSILLTHNTILCKFTKRVMANNKKIWKGEKII